MPNIQSYFDGETRGAYQDEDWAQSKPVRHEASENEPEQHQYPERSDDHDPLHHPSLHPRPAVTQSRGISNESLASRLLDQ